MITTRTPDVRTTHTITRNFRTDHSRSIEMYSMHEALARDRMCREEQRSREATLARELVAQRRWHRVSRLARAAEKRHARKVDWALAR